MDPIIAQALALTHASSAWERTIEITTRGARSGLPRRIEIWLYRVGDTNYLTGMPGRTPDWYRNLEANPEFTLHLKHGVRADLKARATGVKDVTDKTRVFSDIIADLNQPSNPGRISTPTRLSEWLDGSVLIEISFES